MRRHGTHAQFGAILVLLAGLAILSTSCPKPVKPPAAAETEQTPPPPPPAKTMPEEQVAEQFNPPENPEESEAEEIDATIQQQNSQRSILKTVYFDFDKSVIPDSQVPTLQSNAAWIWAHQQYRILIEGHCDERDTIEYNLHLGERRAESVKKYLIELGVPTGRLRTISYGEERPADPGHDEEAWAKNRRVEFTLEK